MLPSFLAYFLSSALHFKIDNFSTINPLCSFVNFNLKNTVSLYTYMYINNATFQELLKMKKIQNNEMFAAFLMGSSELSFSSDSVGNIAGRRVTIPVLENTVLSFHTFEMCSIMVVYSRSLLIFNQHIFYMSKCIRGHIYISI